MYPSRANPGLDIRDCALQHQSAAAAFITKPYISQVDQKEPKSHAVSLQHCEQMFPSISIFLVAHLCGLVHIAIRVKLYL